MGSPRLGEGCSEKTLVGSGYPAPESSGCTVQVPLMTWGSCTAASWRSPRPPRCGFLGVLPRPAVASLGNLLEIHLGVHPRPPESEVLGWTCQSVFTSLGDAATASHSKPTGQRGVIPARAQAWRQEAGLKSRSHLLTQLDTCPSPPWAPCVHLSRGGAPAFFRLSHFRHLHALTCFSL